MQEQSSLVLYAATGPRGELRAGYQPAGTFGAWHLEARSRDRWWLTAADAQLHGYWAEHGPRPLTVRLYLPVPGWWEAPVEIAARGPLRLTGLGPVVASNE